MGAGRRLTLHSMSGACCVDTQIKHDESVGDLGTIQPFTTELAAFSSPVTSTCCRGKARHGGRELKSGWGYSRSSRGQGSALIPPLLQAGRGGGLLCEAGSYTQLSPSAAHCFQSHPCWRPTSCSPLSTMNLQDRGQ